MAEPLSPAARTAITLGTLGLLLALGAVWGWSAVTEPFPGKSDPEACVPTDVAEGERVFPEQVTVSVLNAGGRSGLAGRVREMFTDQGFAEGELANAPDDADVARVQIWAPDPANPAVRLVRSRIPGKVQVFDRDGQAVGVVVVVGDRFGRKLRDGRPSVVADHATSICSPSVA